MVAMLRPQKLCASSISFAGLAFLLLRHVCFTELLGVRQKLVLTVLWFGLYSNGRF